MNVRPSSFPKLALCGQYQGAGGVSEAAMRGTRIDKAFREAWECGVLSWFVPEDEAQPVRWALKQCFDLGGRAGDRDAWLKTEEAACKVKVPGVEHVGTADGVCVKGRWLIDLKSGQKYDYSAQMAAYALGLMIQYDVEDWTTHLLFCDQEEVVSHLWTRGSARAVVAAVLANVGTAPKENEYCGWCAKSLTCTARLERKAEVLAVVEAPKAEALKLESPEFLQILADPVALGRFLDACKAFEDFQAAAKAKAREVLESGGSVPGWGLGKPRALDFVAVEHVVNLVEFGVLSAREVIEAGGSLPAKKVRELCKAAGVPVNEEIETKKQSAAPLLALKK